MALKIKFLWVSEAKNAFGLDKKRFLSVVFKLSKSVNT
jgi:hypothetical protein